MNDDDYNGMYIGGANADSSPTCMVRYSTIAGAAVLVERAIGARLLHAHLLLAALARGAVHARIDHAADADLCGDER